MLNRIIPKEAILLVTIIWAVFIIDLMLPGVNFNHFGIIPRKSGGLIGIFRSPFLHGGFYHIISNTIPLVILPTFVRLSVGSRKMIFVMFVGVIGSGLGAWLFSSGGLVIGASGLVFSLIGFLLADAFVRPTIRSCAVAILSFLLYGGAILSLFTFLPFISWASHFWGLISGIIIALFLKEKKQVRLSFKVTNQ